LNDLNGAAFNVPSLDSTAENSYSNGVLLFKINSTISSKVLAGNSITNFYLVSETSGAAQTVLYTGSVDNIRNIGNEAARVQTILNNLSTTSNTTSTSSNVVSSSNVLTQGSTIKDILNQSNSQSINGDGTSNLQKQNTNIPGYSVDENASSIKNAIVPASSLNTSTVTTNTNK